MELRQSGLSPHTFGTKSNAPNRANLTAGANSELGEGLRAALRPRARINGRARRSTARRNGNIPRFPSWCGSDTKELRHEEDGHLPCPWGRCDLSSSGADAAPLTKGVTVLPNDNIDYV